MAAVAPTSAKLYNDAISVNGAATLIFDGESGKQGSLVSAWEVHVFNNDVAANLAFVGDSGVTVANGLPVVGQTQVVILVPPHTKLYAATAAARDLRILAVPRFI